MSGSWRTRTVLAGALVALVAVGGPRIAVADPVGAGTASGFGLTASLAGTELVPPTPEAGVTAAPFGDDQTNTLVPLDADPLAVNGTLVASGAVHEASDIPTALEQSAQAVAGPYNAQGIGQVEDLEVLVDAVGEGVPVVEADLVRGEAVAVCSAGAVQYSAESEVVNLVIGGEDPLSGPLNDLIDQITSAINASPLVELVSVEPNVVTVTPTGAAVDALVVTVLSALPDNPLVELRIGHAEVSGVGCGSATQVPECSDTADNDGDGVIDAQDPGCHTDGNPDNPDSYDPADDSEADVPQCSDTGDNDGDGLIDAADPGCHTDGDATNNASYDPTDDDETNATGGPLPKTSAPAAASLPSTGGTVPTALASALGVGALAVFALRRRLA
jgi:hypothetical protein